MSVKWRTKPSQINLSEIPKRLQRKMLQKATAFSLYLEAQAKINRPWQDDTGMARSGLKGRVYQSGSSIHILLIHSAEYGINLELSRGGKYAIIYPTIIQNLTLLRSKMREVVSK